MATNGGEPRRVGFAIKDHQDGTDVLRRFLGIVDCADASLLGAAEDFVVYTRNGLRIIGWTACGSLLALLPHSTTPDAIHYIDIADPLDDQGMKKLYPVAPDIDEFILSLYNVEL